jgi:hypothetical protein
MFLTEFIEAGAESGRMAAGFRSTFAPPDAIPRGTWRNGRGRYVPAEAVAGPFVLVTANELG